MKNTNETNTSILELLEKSEKNILKKYNLADFNKSKTQIIKKKTSNYKSNLCRNSDSFLEDEKIKLFNLQNKKILILNGGGMKGICFIGALQSLSERTELKNFDVFCGSSIGSVILFLTIIGYSQIDLFQFVKLFDFSKFQNFNIDNLFINYGLNNGNLIDEIIKQFLIKKNLPINLTFEDLYSQTHKLFILTGTNITTRQCEYMSHLTTPKMKLVDAIRISTSIPFVFTPIYYNNNLYIDGSCTDDLPIKCLYKEPFISYIIDNLFVDTLNISKYILCLYLDNEATQINNLFQYSMTILYSLLTIDTIKQFVNDKKYDIIVIQTKNLNAFDFNINQNIKNKLYLHGYNSIKNKIKII